MPSLWKKPKGNRISRLVSDLQTPSKRGGSLVVETGFPTSLIDLFVKHRDKLKKPKTKKHKSKKLKTVAEEKDDFGGGCQISSLTPLVSHSLCESDEPRFSVVEKVDNFEEVVVNNDLSVEKPVAQETSVAEVIHDCGKVEEERKETVKGFNSKNMMFLLLILVGVLIFVVLLCAEKWIFALITLGICLLLLGITINVGLFMSCENGVWNWFWKGGLVVLGALYTKWFVVGITIGASLLILLEECTENSIFGFFKPCQDAKGKLQSILQQMRKGGRGILTRAVLISGSNKEVLNNGVNDHKQACKGFVSSREIEPECGNGLVSKRGVEGNGEGELGSRNSSLCSESSMLIEEEKQVKSIYEFLALESNNSNCPESLELNTDPEREEGANGRKEGDGDGKKNKKFWKKFIPKKKYSKRKTNEYEGKTSVAQSNSSMIQDNAIGLKEEDEEDDEQGISQEGSLTSRSRSRSRSSLSEENEGRIVNFGGEMLQLDNIRNPKPCGILKKEYGNMKYFTAMVIPLTGLIGGRMLAVVVTVICYLVFKMVRS